MEYAQANAYRLVGCFRSCGAEGESFMRFLRTKGFISSSLPDDGYFVGGLVWKKLPVLEDMDSRGQAAGDRTPLDTLARPGAAEGVPIAPLEGKRGMVAKILSGRHPRVLAEKFVIPENAVERLTPQADPRPVPSSWRPRPVESMTERSVEILHSTFQSAFELVNEIKEQHGQALVIKMHLYGSAWNGKANKRSNLNYWVEGFAYEDGQFFRLPRQNNMLIENEMIVRIFKRLNIAIGAHVPNPDGNLRPHQNFYVFPENQPEIPNLIREQLGSDKLVTPEGPLPPLPPPARSGVGASERKEVLPERAV